MKDKKRQANLGKRKQPGWGGMPESRRKKRSILFLWALEEPEQHRG